MNILMIAPQPFFQPRGTPFSVLGRLHALSKLGHTIDLLTYHIGQNVEISNVNIHRIVSIPFIKNVKIGPSLTKIPLDVTMFLKSVSMLHQNKYDLLHTHEEAGFMGILLQRWFGIPHLYDMHSSLPQQLHNFQFSKSKVVHNIFEKFENMTLKSAQGVITICPELYDYVDKLKIANNHILIENVLNYASLFSESNGSDDTSILQEAKWNEKIKILYVGTFEPYQGLDLLIKSAKDVVHSYPDAHFILVGGNSDQIKKYKDIVTNERLNECFTFTGSVSPKMADRFITFSDILVSPRISGNNTPLKIYSYLRSGKPIIATRHITHTQVLDDSVSILTKTDPNEFAEGILKIIGDSGLKQNITNNALQLAEKKYSHTIYVKKIQQVIDNIYND